MSVNLLNEVLSSVHRELEHVMGSVLVEMILYGSFARGDFDCESDIDIAVIVNKDRREIKTYQRRLLSFISEISLEYDILVSINYIPLSDFEEYKNVLPYYRNIDQEGVRIAA